MSNWLDRAWQKVTRYIPILLMLLPAFALLWIMSDANQKLPKSLQNTADAEAWKSWQTAFTVLVTATFTLTGAIMGGLLQSQREVDKEMRDSRRTRTRAYREYLEWLMSLAQRSGLANTFRDLQVPLPVYIGSLEITDLEKEKVYTKMPPIWEHSLIDDENTRQILDSTFLLGITYVFTEERAEREKIAPQLRTACLEAFSQLDRYETAV